MKDISSLSSGVEDIIVPKETTCLPEIPLPVDAINAIISVGGILLKGNNSDLLSLQTATSERPKLFFMSENGFALNALPSRYIPIIPTILVNKLQKEIFPKYNLQDIIDNLKRKLDGKNILPMTPWYKDFKGTIKDSKDGSYTVVGTYSTTGTDTIEITLPIGTDAENYKVEVLEGKILQRVIFYSYSLWYDVHVELGFVELKTKMDVIDYKEYSNNTGDKFVITFPLGRLARLNNLEISKELKLEKAIHIELIAFDKYGNITRY